MVFESLVVDILNRFLKPYVKKLDTSQLKVGVWKGAFVSPLTYPWGAPPAKLCSRRG